MSVKNRFIHAYKNLVSHAIPCIIAIAISGIVDIEVALNHPLEDLLSRHIKDHDIQLMIKRISWYFLQIIPAFLFGTISDHHLRKKSLIYTQIIGVLGGILLLIFHFEFWVFLLIGLTFNPLSVARAAMLDNYPKLSALKVIAITFMIKNASWLFIDLFSNVSFQSVIFWILPIQVINTILIYYLFHDKFEDKTKMKKFKEMEEHHKGNLIRINKYPLIITIIALSLSETTFYLLWTFLETNQYLERWLFITTLGTYLGTSFTLLYRKIPHSSLIAILYFSGSGIMLITLLFTNHFGLSYTTNLIAAMTHYSIIGGIYLPFVADSVIELSGSIRKATGSAIFEIGDVLALFLAAIGTILFISSPFLILVLNTILYGIAAILQKLSERCNTGQMSTNI